MYYNQKRKTNEGVSSEFGISQCAPRQGSWFKKNGFNVCVNGSILIKMVLMSGSMDQF